MLPGQLRSALGVVFVVALVFTAGCTKGRHEAAGMNNAVTAASKRLTSSGKQFADAVNKAAESGKEADVAAVRKEFANLQEVCRAARQEMNELNAEGVVGGGEFKAAAVKFFEGQEAMLETDFRKMVDAVEGKGLTKIQRKKTIDAARVSAAGKEAKDLAEIQDAQRALCARHNIPVRNDPGPAPKPAR
jgi:hypothetical protein